MCLMVWMAAERPLPTFTLTNPQTPDPVEGYHHMEPVAADSGVRARFSLPFVSYVGSHEGCGCGYNSSGLEGEGFETVDQVRPLVAAMSPEERDDFEARQRTRERLRDLVLRAQQDGAVEVFACWAGDEVDPAIAVEEVDPAYFAERLAPMGEGVLYRARRMT